MTINANTLADIRRAYPREKDVEKLRRWISLLLLDRDGQADELVKLRGYRPEISLGTVNSQKGREE
jgi:hypothetical protein